jgi:outer membrane protein insertion porin family
MGTITFRNPYLNDSLTSMQLDVYRTATNYVTYYETKTGASVTLGRWLSEYATGSLSLFAETMKFTNPQIGLCDDPLSPRSLVCTQLGSQSTTGFRTQVSRDTRDYFQDPRSGWRGAAGFDLGTAYLGGTNNYYKYSLDVIKYTPLPFDTRHSIRVRYGAAVGIDGHPIPLTERFFVGGINTLRGFVFGRAGPVTQFNSLLGAAEQLIFNNDFIFTISSEAKLNGVIFFDYGKGFNDNESISFHLRKSAGLEGRWISPFGPLRAAYGINLDHKPGERKGVFEFTIGSVF